MCLVVFLPSSRLCPLYRCLSLPLSLHAIRRHAVLPLGRARTIGCISSTCLPVPRTFIHHHSSGIQTPTPPPLPTTTHPIPIYTLRAHREPISILSRPPCELLSCSATATVTAVATALYPRKRTFACSDSQCTLSIYPSLYLPIYQSIFSSTLLDPNSSCGLLVAVHPLRLPACSPACPSVHPLRCWLHSEGARSHLVARKHTKLLRTGPRDRSCAKLASSSLYPSPTLTSSCSPSSSVDESVSTPRSQTSHHHHHHHFPSRQHHDESRARFFDWHKKAAARDPGADDFTADDLLFPPDDDETLLPLFPSASPLPQIRTTLHDAVMPSSSSPIEIGSSRQASSSPRNQTSNLTSALQQRSDNMPGRSDSATTIGNGNADARPRQESTSMLGTTPYGARQIPAGSMQRRESYGLGNGSLMGGMSWGGISMGSFIKDDLMMTGTSPYNFQSPSFHSSSYLPKMEANYMKDYVCCDIHLDSMHELLQHYEEAHAAQPTQTMGRTPKDQQYPNRQTNATSTAQSVQQQANGQPGNMPQLAQLQHLQPHTNSPLFSGQSNDQIGGFDSLDSMDMDMDEGTPASQPQGSQFQPQPQFGRQQPRGPAVNVNLANAFQGHGLNSATPTTPHATQPGMSFAHNPTVSSVNTPSLSTQTTSQNTATPDPSQPGTPAELDPDFVAQMSNLNSADYNHLMQGNFDINSLNNAGNMNLNGASATIDNPEKRLLSKQGNGNKGFANPAFSNAQHSELSKRVRENQLLNGLAGVGGFVGEEIKPFKCPVIGCEKAYKNQNGLKYHKQHGHQNQQLKENPDGTFSIVDPATSIPYPGTVGMEKEKPYRCEVCGKRYKNLNGLKYHRQHSPPCNPELRNNLTNMPGMPSNLQNMNANVAGASLVGMNENMGY